MTHYLSPITSPIMKALFCGSLLGILIAISPVEAQNQRGNDAGDQILQGRAMLDENDPRSVAILRDAAQTALRGLIAATGPEVLSAAPNSLPDDVLTSGLARKAAEAHLYWGLAADRFAQRDEAITALARAVRLSRAVKGGDSTLQRDAANDLGRVLREGLPFTAPDDTLVSIAELAHGNLWKPRRLNFDVAPLKTEGPQKLEFLITDGKVFPPVPNTPNGTASLVRVPPLYQNVPSDKLPQSLQLDKMIAGYVRETSGPLKGQWRQIVRVFYASPFLTRDRRNDMPRAQELATQFLKIHALFWAQLGVSNLYSTIGATGDRANGGLGGVTTLWLMEISAIWPADEEDPRVAALMGPLMPKPNTGENRNTQPTEVVVSPLSYPWEAAISAQIDSAPGEILFWKAGLQRPPAEWVRELSHEYGHVALPPFGGFRPPLEPYANGVLGETVGMLWAAALPDQWSETPELRLVGAVAALPLPPRDDEPRVTPVAAQNAKFDLTEDFSEHIENNALPALKLFAVEGPNSPLKARTNRDGLRYLQGLTTYVERVYGPPLLGKALQPLAVRAAQTENAMARRSLLNTQHLLDALPFVWRDAWNGEKSLSIWLPGALAGTDFNAQTLVARGPVKLRVGTHYSGWLWVPAGADSLRIDGPGIESARVEGGAVTTAPGALRLNFGGKTGWIKFSLTPGADVMVNEARFDKRL